MNGSAEIVARSFYTAVNSGSGDELESVLHPGVRWHRPPDVPVTGTLDGVARVAGMWRSFNSGLESFEIEPTRFETTDELVLAAITMRGVPSDGRGPFEFGGAQVFRVVDGLIAEVWEFRSLPEARALLAG